MRHGAAIWPVLLLAIAIAGCLPAGVMDVVAARDATARGQVDEAIRLYSQAIASGNLPDNLRAAAYMGRGFAHSAKREFDAATTDCEAALRLRPGFPDACVCRGVAFAGQKQYDLAIADCDVAIGLKPDDALAHRIRGEAFFAKGDFDHAIASYDDAIRAKPDSADVYFVRAVAYRLQGQAEHALADVEMAIRLRSGDSNAYNLRGILLSAQHKDEAAMADFATAIRLKPDNPAPYDSRGVREFAVGRLAEAAADFEQYVRLAPTNPYGPLWLHLARANVGTNDMAEFTANLAKVDRGYWPNPILALYQGQSKPDQLRAATSEDDPGGRRGHQCQADFYLAEYLLLRQDRAAARTLLEHAAEGCPPVFREHFLATAELLRIGPGDHQP
jgi:lipoprotein NlpI